MDIGGLLLNSVICVCLSPLIFQECFFPSIMPLLSFCLNPKGKTMAARGSPEASSNYKP